MTWATRLGFGTPIEPYLVGYHVKFEAFRQIHFQDNKSRILAHCALATSVEKDAIGEDKAFAHVGRILHTHNAMPG